jgi:hypothetical protein
VKNYLRVEPFFRARFLKSGLMTLVDLPFWHFGLIMEVDFSFSKRAEERITGTWLNDWCYQGSSF